jgi:hypothetical protein
MVGIEIRHAGCCDDKTSGRIRQQSYKAEMGYAMATLVKSAFVGEGPFISV